MCASHRLLRLEVVFFGVNTHTLESVRLSLSPPSEIDMRKWNVPAISSITWAYYGGHEWDGSEQNWCSQQSQTIGIRITLTMLHKDKCFSAVQSWARQSLSDNHSSFITLVFLFLSTFLSSFSLPPFLIRSSSYPRGRKETARANKEVPSYGVWMLRKWRNILYSSASYYAYYVKEINSSHLILVTLNSVNCKGMRSSTSWDLTFLEKEFLSFPFSWHT